MNRISRIFLLFALLAIGTFGAVPPARAFDGRSGDTVVIKAGEVVEDDVYVTANRFVLDGTVKGDLIVFASDITINGSVEGDLIAAGQTVVLEGTVTDDARIAGSVLQLGSDAKVGGDLLAAGAGLETQDGSTVDGELVVGAAQVLLAGDVAGDVLAGSGSLELRGNFGGDVKADVGDAETSGPPPSIYMPQSGVSMPSVPPGFTISDEAKIKGNLDYTQSKDIKIPAGSVGGKVTRTEPVVGTEARQQLPTPAEKAVKWSLDLLRSIVTLILFGLLLGWLAPLFMKSLLEKLQTKPALSLGWGVVAYAAFFFALLVIIVVMILGGVVFGFLTLGGVTGTLIWVGILALFAMVVAFVLITSFLTKIVVGWLGGKWIVRRFNPALAEHRFWPLALGVLIVALLVALPFVGWLFSLAFMFLGLGALWLWGRDTWQARKTV
jgi:cytoskeletal protein CcmA (bactofilin family)